MNNRSSQPGCLITVILIIVFLFFLSGNITMCSGDYDPSDSASSFSIVIAIIVDFAIVIGIIYFIGKNLFRKSENEPKPKIQGPVTSNDIKKTTSSPVVHENVSPALPYVPSKPYMPQSIDYTSQRISTIKPVDIPVRIAQMRKIKLPNHEKYVSLSYSGYSGYSYLNSHSAELFKMQAKFMVDYSDNYSEVLSFHQYSPTYALMTDTQLRTYFTWRSQVRRGIIGKIDVSYAFVYIYELLMLIGATSKENAIDLLIQFWVRFREYDLTIDRYMRLWLKDFFVYYRLDGNFLDLQNRFPDDKNTRSVKYITEILNHNYNDKTSFLNELSTYHYHNSIFYNDILGYMLDQCLPLVLDQIDHAFQDIKVSLPELLLGKFQSTHYWTPFANAVFELEIPEDSFKIRINALEEYGYDNGSWFSRSLSENIFPKSLLGYITKTMEAELRELTGFRAKLTPNVVSMIQEPSLSKKVQAFVFSSRFESIIRDTAKAYFSKSGIAPQAFKRAKIQDLPIIPPEVRIDISKLDAIRSASIITQERLTIEEEYPSEITYPPASSEQMPLLSDDAEISSNSDHDKIILSPAQVECLSIILSGKSVNARLADLSKQSGKMRELLLDSINEALYPYLGDTIIDQSSSEPYVYEEYFEYAQDLLKGE
jgi:hypothetical protein